LLFSWLLIIIQDGSRMIISNYCADGLLKIFLFSTFVSMEWIFISYCTKDSDTAFSLCAFLERNGYPCWIAPRDVSSGNYAGEITRALRAARVVLVICSRNANQSDHVKNEVNMAFNQRKVLIPYCLEPDVFDDDMEYYLSTKQQVRATGDKERDFKSIVGMLEFHFRGRKEAPSPAPGAPPASSNTSFQQAFPMNPIGCAVPEVPMPPMPTMPSFKGIPTLFDGIQTPPLADTSAYYVILSGQQQGPYTRRQLQNMLTTGQVNSQTLAWKQGLSTWMFLKDILG